MDHSDEEEEESDEEELGSCTGQEESLNNDPEDREEQAIVEETPEEDILVVRFGWCSVLLAIFVSIWYIFCLHWRQLQLEEARARSEGRCTWHYGRGVILISGTCFVWLSVLAWYLKPQEKTDLQERTELRIKQEVRDKGEAAVALSRVIHGKSASRSSSASSSPSASPPRVAQAEVKPKARITIKLKTQPTVQPKPQVEVTSKTQEDVKEEEEEETKSKDSKDDDFNNNSDDKDDRNDLEEENRHYEEYSSESEDDMANQKPIEIVEIGSRLQKYWTVGEDKVTITCSAKQSTLCKLTQSGFQEVSSFLSGLSHLCVQKIFSVECVQSDTSSNVVITQQFWRRGSVRDLIHKVEDPMFDWDVKYKFDSGKPLPLEQMRGFGCQILEGMLYLYEQKFKGQPLCPLMQVQTGNIFIVDDGQCVLGGFENTLLGYRTSLYATLAQNNLLEYSDIIMFGHVMYEMCTGQVLKVVMPTEEHYDNIEDEKCRDVVKYIFKYKRGQFRHSIKTIKNIEFFHGSGSMYERAAKMGRKARLLSIHAKEKLKQAFDIQRRNVQSTWVEVKNKARGKQRSLSATRSSEFKDVEMNPFVSHSQNKARKNKSQRSLGRSMSADSRVYEDSLGGTKFGFRKKKDKKKQLVTTEGRLSRDNAKKLEGKGKRKQSDSPGDRVSHTTNAADPEREERAPGKLFRTDFNKPMPREGRARSKSVDGRLSRERGDRVKPRQRSKSVDDRSPQGNADGYKHL